MERTFKTFIEPDGLLYNEEHPHLIDADIGMLWCSETNSRQMNAIVGEAEIPAFRGGKWQKVRQEQQLEEWFGEVPDFLITIDANFATAADNASFCATIEHELFHCGQDRDGFGMPKFNRMTGKPVFAIRGHDCEEFVGVVARYGIGSAAGKTAELVHAANKGPLFGEAHVNGACGTCDRKVA